ncbi:hypothetical protein ScPMuIL_017418 [Solemya velum]
MEGGSEKSDVERMQRLLSEVQKNYGALLAEWTELKQELQDDHDQSWGMHGEVSISSLSVNKDDLSQLATEIAQLKQNLTRLLTSNMTAASGRVEMLEKDYWKSRCETVSNDCKNEVNYWKSRCETVTNDCQLEKESNLKLRCEIQQLSEQLVQQSDYCSTLGAVSCTLLWRVSRCEDSIQSILIGTKVDEFFGLLSSTLQSYVSAYKSEWPEDQTDETQFILALCGIITNIAASAYGREFLVTNEHGRAVLDTYFTALLEAPNGKSAKLKNLILMALYNVSINQKGIRYISSRPGIISMLSWLLKDETEVENRINTLRLMQSVVYEYDNINIKQELQEIPMSVLQQLSKHKNQDVQDLSLELITDINSLGTEP